MWTWDKIPHSPTVCSLIDSSGSRSSNTGAAATVYLLRSVNPKLFFSPRPLSEMRRKPLLRRWYRVNALRLAASGVALAAVHQARVIRITSRPE